MTVTTPSSPERLGTALEAFRDSSNPDPEDHARLRKFVAFCGVTVTVEAVQAYKIEEFLKGQVATSTPPRAFMAVLKAFFAYVKVQGHIATDPMKNVRLPRATGTTVRRTATTGTGASVAPVSYGRTVEAEYVTRARHEEMLQEVDRLRIEERQRISALLEEAIKDGDLSENAGYDDAKMRQGLLEARIRELEDKLRRVALIEDQDTDSISVGVGSEVTVREDGTDQDDVYTVVGPEETDPRRNRISHKSPVGKALLGRKVGEVAEVVIPGGSTRYVVIAVNRGA